MAMRIVRCLGLVIALLGLSGPLAAQDCAAPAARDDGWAVAAPDTVGLDPARICAIADRLADANVNVHSVLVVRQGKLVFEHYRSGEDEITGRPVGTVAYAADIPHDLRSISKSVTSLLVGIALESAPDRTLDAPVLDFFPQYPELRTPEKERITVRHLLTMSAGLAWDESSRPYSDPANSERILIAAPDAYRYALEQPVAQPPGTHYQYNSGGSTLLVGVIEKLSGQSFPDFAREKLFAPLGITDTVWAKLPNGVAAAASGLRLRPRDLAKIGQLVLARGEWQGKQIVPAYWIDASITPQINGATIFFYGYQWWLGRSLIDRREIRWAAGVGWGGQRLFIVPSQDLVMVSHAGLYKAPAPVQGVMAAEILNDYVLAALREP
jgi:CubicO group peptidase (beta-lactamase class C family)